MYNIVRVHYNSQFKCNNPAKCHQPIRLGYRFAPVKMSLTLTFLIGGEDKRFKCFVGMTCIIHMCNGCLACKVIEITRSASQICQPCTKAVSMTPVFSCHWVFTLGPNNWDPHSGKILVSFGEGANNHRLLKNSFWTMEKLIQWSIPMKVWFHVSLTNTTLSLVSQK